jgi:hypothetical protein
MLEKENQGKSFTKNSSMGRKKGSFSDNGSWK